MNIFYRSWKTIIMLALMLSLVFVSACGLANTQAQSPNPIKLNQTSEYSQLARGDSPANQDFGNWVIQTSQGLIQDAYVRDSNKLGVVISSQVLPTEVKTLAQSLAQGFRHNFPNQDLTVLIYAPDKKLILTARYDYQSRQLNYSLPS